MLNSDLLCSPHAFRNDLDPHRRHHAGQTDPEHLARRQHARKRIRRPVRTANPGLAQADRQRKTIRNYMYDLTASKQQAAEPCAYDQPHSPKAQQMNTTLVFLLAAFTILVLSISASPLRAQSTVLYSDYNQIVFHRSELRHPHLITVELKEDMDDAKAHCIRQNSADAVIHAITQVLIVHCVRHPR